MAQQGKYTRKGQKHRWIMLLIAVLAGILLFGGVPAMQNVVAELKVDRLGDAQVPEWVDVQLIRIDGASRRGEKLEDIQDIVIHYVGNPGTTAQQNRNYFDSSASQVSSHFLVGLEGEVIQCVPLDEKSSASNHRNRDTISVEVCHPDDTGEFTDVTYEALVRLTAWLLEAAELDENDVIRHYDITGKECPRYFVTNGESWQEFLADVSQAVN